MKAPNFIWPVLFLVTILTCWLAVPPARPIRIKVENDLTDISGLSAAPGCSIYDPYFDPENRIPPIFIPASKVK
jgi:hypothetical protein